MPSGVDAPRLGFPFIFRFRWCSWYFTLQRAELLPSRADVPRERYQEEERGGVAAIPERKSAPGSVFSRDARHQQACARPVEFACARGA